MSAPVELAMEEAIRPGRYISEHASFPLSTSSNRSPRGSWSSSARVCEFLVDTWCLGVKNALGPKPVERRKLPSFCADAFRSYPGEPVEVPLVLAQRIVFGAIGYARGLGFEPHADFAKAAKQPRFSQTPLPANLAEVGNRSSSVTSPAGGAGQGSDSSRSHAPAARSWPPRPDSTTRDNDTAGMPHLVHGCAVREVLLFYEPAASLLSRSCFPCLHADGVPVG